MRFLRLLLLPTLWLAALAAEPPVQMKPYRVGPSDLYFKINYAVDSGQIFEIHVTGVNPGSLAEQHGIRSGDRLTAIDGVSVAAKKFREIIRNDRMVARGQWTFEGRRGLLQRKWSITVDARALKKKPEPDEPDESTDSAAAASPAAQSP